MEGAGFKVFLIQDLKGVKDGGLKPSEGNAFKAEDFIGYDYSEDETAHYYENGKKVSVEELFTDKKGIGEMMSGALIETEARTILNKGKAEGRKEAALRMLQDGELPMDKIAKYSGLDITEVELLAGIQMV